MYFLWLVPKNALSRLVGHMAALKIPHFLRIPVFKTFGRFFGVNFYEIKKPISEFASLQDFFIRELKEGLRPISDLPFVSPCDGTVGQCGPIEAGQLLQIKGKPYILTDLLGEEAPPVKNGYFTTIYLSPKDYHRFHAPCETRILKVRYIPGYLWPVNPWAVKHIHQLFCVNERMVIWLDTGAILVAVGATLVGKVKLKFDAELSTNMKCSQGQVKYYESTSKLFEKGEELGHFEFGSTIIMLTKQPLEFTVQSRTVQVGQGAI